jgi:hypothetical protein
MVLIKTDYTAWRIGAISKMVCCEKCGTDFGYTMYREASGQGTSLYYIDETGAADRANRRAESNLQRALADEVEPVACPTCGCFQRNMVWEARRRYLKYMRPFFAVIGLVVLVPFFFCSSMYVNVVLNEIPVVSAERILYAAIGLAALFVLMPIVRFLLSLRYDPNNDSPQQRARRGYGLGIPRADYERYLAQAGAAPPTMEPAPATESAFQDLSAHRRSEQSIQVLDNPRRREREPGTESAGMYRLFFEDIDSDEMVDFRKSLNENPVIDKFDPHIIYHTWKQNGICFEFHYGKLVFIFLGAEGFEGCRQYRGELPMQLAFSDTRADVERKLGKPELVDNMGGAVSAFATYPANGIKISFVSKDLMDMGNRILSIGLFPVKHSA